MSKGAKIAAKVAIALAKAGAATGDGPLIATLRRASIKQATPWDAPVDIAGDVFSVTILDDGIKNRYDGGSLIVRQVRVLTIGATGVVPAMSDLITVRGVEHRVTAVMPLAPGGTDLLYEVEIAA